MQMMMRHRPHSQRGFTLLEMIAAIALLSLAMLALSGGIGAALHTLLPSADAIQAAEIAHTQLDSICIEGNSVLGQQTGAQGRAQWELNVQAANSANPRSTVRLLDANVQIRIGRRRYRFSTVCAVSNAA